MDSAGKRKNTEGTARGKRRLEEQPAGRVSKRRKLKDDLTSQDSQESLEPTQSGPSLPVPSQRTPEPTPVESGPSLPVPSQRTPVPTPVESGPSLPGPSQGQGTSMGPPSQFGPSLGQRTSMGPPSQFGPSLGQRTPMGPPPQLGPSLAQRMNDLRNPRGTLGGIPTRFAPIRPGSDPGPRFLFGPESIYDVNNPPSPYSLDDVTAPVPRAGQYLPNTYPRNYMPLRLEYDPQQPWFNRRTPVPGPNQRTPVPVPNQRTPVPTPVESGPSLLVPSQRTPVPTPVESGPSLPVPSQRTPVPTPVESGPSLPGPSQGQRTPMGPPSQPGPFTQFGPSLGQPTPTGAPSQPGPLPDSPPALDDSDGGSPSEPPVPEGVGLSPGDNHLWIMDWF